jgi:hypothetical protein
VYDQHYIKASPYYSYINTYPGITYGVQSFKDLFLDKIGNSNLVKTNVFDIKPLPLQETGQEFAGFNLIPTDTALINKKNIDGNCMEIDCSMIPEFCSGYSSC